MSLYKIEMNKIQLSAYLWAAAGIFACVLGIGLLFLFLGAYGGEEDALFTSWNRLYALLTAITFACFSIFSAVAAARVIVDEYCEKNAVILLTYPLERKKILNTKCLIVLCLTAVSGYASNVAVMGILYITAGIFGIMPEQPGKYFLISLLLSSALAGILAFEMGIISGAAGWKRRSTITAVVCSVILMCFVPNLIAGLGKHMVWGMLLLVMVFGLAAEIMYQMLAKGIERMEI